MAGIIFVSAEKAQDVRWGEVSCISIRYFRSVFGRYFSVFTIPIPKENSVGTFRYKKGGSAPLFPQKGGNGPLFEKLDPLLEKRGEERGEVYKKGGDRYRPKYPNLNRQNTDTEKTAGSPRYNSSRYGR